MALKQGRKDRQARAAEIRRAQLLDVAWDMLKELGLGGFNMRALGLRAGYTAGAMYGYFVSRDHILQALRERWVGELTMAMAQIRSPRRARRAASALGADSDLTVDVRGIDHDAAAEARERFLARSELWLSHLVREPFALPLLMLKGPQSDVHAMPDASADGVGTLPLASLELATKPCVLELEAAGWTHEQARQLQREALCLGVGLADLGASQGRGGEAASVPLEAEGFRQTLARWLREGDWKAVPQDRPPEAGQPDLFAG